MHLQRIRISTFTPSSWTPNGLPDDGWFDSYTTTIMQRFERSPEASELSGGIGWADLLMDYARGYLGRLVAQLGAAEVQELVFEIFPRKVSCDPTEAPAIIRELRAFFAFLKREFALSNADSCLAELADGAEQRLARELADQRRTQGEEGQAQASPQDPSKESLT